MQQVITQEQAREITGGRRGGPPTGSGQFRLAEYDEAVRLLRQCTTIESAKRFATFADAKATWAKIVHDETALRLSRALKLHAAKEMALIAEQERPTIRGRKRGMSGRGSQPGAQSLLKENGMTGHEAQQALALSRMSEPRFRKLVDSPRPPALGTVHLKSDGWAQLSNGLSNVLRNSRRYSPRDAIRLLTNSRTDVAVWTDRFREIGDWTDEVLRILDARSK